ncbi:MAG: XamI family restriction endonuclease [Elusimicrobia bacterium]|nr:XamI family restriction endonuclease [Elusimicrobiota bacterium]
MGVNLDKPHRWTADIARSVDLYNRWFMRFAPKAFRRMRIRVTKSVENLMSWTVNLTNVRPVVLKKNPAALAMLRMATCPPVARDRLIGLADVSRSLVQRMETECKLPVHLHGAALDTELEKISRTIGRMLDPDIVTWTGRSAPPPAAETRRAATIIADRHCGATADPIIRNAQEARQLELIGKWLRARGYKVVSRESHRAFDRMAPGTYCFRLNVPVKLKGGGEFVKIPIDAVVMPKKAKSGELPLLIEAKSAGDFANVNKRRKEEAKKAEQLRRDYGPRARYILFLCGYFDSGYLSYEAADGIDWVWEHRIEDLTQFGL